MNLSTALEKSVTQDRPKRNLDEVKQGTKATKKRRIEPATKDDFRYYKLLMNTAELHRRLIENRILNAYDVRSSITLPKWQIESINADIDFMRAINYKMAKIIILLKNLTNQIPYKKISDKCYKLIIEIHNECTPLRKISDEMQKLRAVSIGDGLRQKLIKEGYRPDKKEEIHPIERNLILFKNIQKSYIPYVLCDPNQAFQLAKIALFWHKKTLALQFLKKITLISKNGAINPINVKAIRETLDVYQKKFPFSKETDEKLIEYYNSIKAMVTTEPKLSRTVSCHNGTELYENGEN